MGRSTRRPARAPSGWCAIRLARVRVNHQFLSPSAPVPTEIQEFGFPESTRRPCLLARHLDLRTNGYPFPEFPKKRPKRGGGRCCQCRVLAESGPATHASTSHWLRNRTICRCGCSAASGGTLDRYLNRVPTAQRTIPSGARNARQSEPSELPFHNTSRVRRR